MKSRTQLKAMGYEEKQTVHYKTDFEGNITNEPREIYIFFGSVAKAGDTLNVVDLNCPTNPMWSYGRMMPCDMSELEEIREYADKNFDDTFYGRYDVLNGNEGKTKAVLS